jgi:hypothetical protein
VKLNVYPVLPHIRSSEASGVALGQEYVIPGVTCMRQKETFQRTVTDARTQKRRTLLRIYTVLIVHLLTRARASIRSLLPRYITSFDPKFSIRLAFFDYSFFSKAFAHFRGTENAKRMFLLLFRKCIIMLC